MDHELFVRECHLLATDAGKKGNQAFGAVLVNNGQVIMTAENTVNRDDYNMHHAEYNLVIGSKQVFSKEILKEGTLYASTAPCLFCTATILVANISRIVYSVSYETFAKLIPDEYKYISLRRLSNGLAATQK